MQNRSGFTLLELMTGAFILMVGIAGVTGLAARFFRYDLYLTPKMQAAYLSQEALEKVKNIRDTNWINGVEWTNNLFCCDDECSCEVDYNDSSLSKVDGVPLKLKMNEATGFYSYDSGDSTDFVRVIDIKKISGESGVYRIDVCVTTSWGNKENEKVRACTELYNWYSPKI